MKRDWRLLSSAAAFTAGYVLTYPFALAVALRRYYKEKP